MLPASHRDRRSATRPGWCDVLRRHGCTAAASRGAGGACSQPERAKHDVVVPREDGILRGRATLREADGRSARPRSWGGVPGGSGRTPTRRPCNPEPKIPVAIRSSLAASTRGRGRRTPDAGAASPPLSTRHRHRQSSRVHRRRFLPRAWFIGDVHDKCSTSTPRRGVGSNAVELDGAIHGSALAVRGPRRRGHLGAVYLVGGRFKGDEREKYLTLMRMDIVTGTDPRDGSGEPRRFVRWMPAETSGPKPSALSRTQRDHGRGRARGVRRRGRPPYISWGRARVGSKTMTWRASSSGRDPGASQPGPRPRTSGRRAWRRRGATTRSSSSAERARVFQMFRRRTRARHSRGGLGNGCDPRDLRPGRARAHSGGGGGRSVLVRRRRRKRRKRRRGGCRRARSRRDGQHGSTARRRRREVEAQRSPRRSSWARE